MPGECQVNVKSQSELDIGGRETCLYLYVFVCILQEPVIDRDFLVSPDHVYCCRGHQDQTSRGL